MSAALLQADAGNPRWMAMPAEAELRHIPGERGLPVVGLTLWQLADPEGLTRTLLARHGPVHRFRSFGRWMVALSGADAIERVLTDPEGIFSAELGWSPMIGQLLPRSLMLMDGAVHAEARRSLAAAFEPDTLHHHAEPMNALIRHRVLQWSDRKIAFYPAAKALALDLAATCYLGIALGPEADRINRAFIDTLQASLGLVRRPLPMTAMGRGMAARRYLADHFSALAAERRNGDGQDMFSRFCRARRVDGTLLPVEEIADQIIFLLTAAHNSNTSTACAMVLLLAQNPEWQVRLRAECLGVTDGRRDLAADELPRLVLLGMAMREALRLMPPVPFTPRRALQPFEFGGYAIPAGTLLGISAVEVHKDPQHWDDPDRFDPMRFAPEAVRARHPYAWVPFGGGAHTCLGIRLADMQIKVLMHHLLTRYRIVIEPGYDPGWQVWPTPRPRDGLNVRMVPLD